MDSVCFLQKEFSGSSGKLGSLDSAYFYKEQIILGKGIWFIFCVYTSTLQVLKASLQDYGING